MIIFSTFAFIKPFTMSNTIDFTKMHGIGNDYIYIDCTCAVPENLPDLSREMSPRHTSIGSDGIILILPSEIADFKMRIFNADGSEAKMCGNGSRCVGKYVYDHGLTSKTDITLETLSGVKYLTLSINETTGKVDQVTVDMGLPSFETKEIGMNIEEDTFVGRRLSTTDGRYSHKLTAVSIGNPHGVIFMPTLEGLDINEVGKEYENHPIWTDRANIEFIECVDRHRLKMRVWERGSGETQACGTGACAAAMAAVATGRADIPVTVNLLGGDLIIDVNDKGHIMMTGPATEVFSGQYTRQITG